MFATVPAKFLGIKILGCQNLFLSFSCVQCVQEDFLANDGV